MKNNTTKNDKIIYQLNNRIKGDVLGINKMKNANQILINNMNSITKLMQNEM